MTALEGKRIVLGVTGSIACFKSAQLCSTLVQAGAMVDVVLTDAAQQFITPLTFQGLTRRPVYAGLYDVLPDLSSAHVELGARAGVLVICPASATTMSRLARGSAEDILSCTALASKAPLVLAPAMNVNMWEHPATQENVATLQRRGALFVGPVEGYLAEGIRAMGRLAPLEDVVAGIRVALGSGSLKGRHVVVTAGGTQEPIDPVRYVGNRSSGKMGYAVAEAARDRGARVTLISGPTSLPSPWAVELVLVTTAMEMREAVLEACGQAEALIMAAAVADFRPAEASEQKIKKDGQALTLHLVPNPDFSGEAAARAGERLVKVYFAAETENLVASAQQKLARLQADLLVANNVAEAGSGFGSDTNRVTLLGHDGSREDLPLMSKVEVAERILDRVEELLPQTHPFSGTGPYARGTVV